jgi:hypothetical protein
MNMIGRTLLIIFKKLKNKVHKYTLDKIYHYDIMVKISKGGIHMSDFDGELGIMVIFLVGFIIVISLGLFIKFKKK